MKPKPIATILDNIHRNSTRRIDWLGIACKALFAGWLIAVAFGTVLAVSFTYWEMIL